MFKIYFVLELNDLQVFKLKHSTAMERSEMVPLVYCCCKYAEEYLM